MTEAEKPKRKRASPLSLPPSISPFPLDRTLLTSMLHMDGLFKSQPGTQSIKTSRRTLACAPASTSSIIHKIQYILNTR